MISSKSFCVRHGSPWHIYKLSLKRHKKTEFNVACFKCNPSFSCPCQCLCDTNWLSIVLTVLNEKLMLALAILNTTFLINITSSGKIWIKIQYLLSLLCVKLCIHLFCMHYFIYFFQQSECVLEGGTRYSSFQNNFMALGFH